MPGKNKPRKKKEKKKKKKERNTYEHVCVSFPVCLVHGCVVVKRGGMAVEHLGICAWQEISLRKKEKEQKKRNRKKKETLMCFLLSVPCSWPFGLRREWHSGEVAGHTCPA